MIPIIFLIFVIPKVILLIRCYERIHDNDNYIDYH